MNFTLRVPAPLLDRVKERARAQGQPISHVLIRCLEDYLASAA